MEESKGVSLAILGIVAVVAVFGLVLLFTGEKTGQNVQLAIGERVAAQIAACEEAKAVSPPGVEPVECRGLGIRSEIQADNSDRFGDDYGYY